MRGRTLHLCAGALAQRYEERGGRVRWHGKPHPAIYETCLGLLEIADRARILAIGDSLRTDIAGAAGVGIDSLFVTGGIHAEEFGAGTPDPGRVAAAFAALPYRPVGVTGILRW
jgi:ribonucleotide monophosphatase NagD (HAD superfamily)